MSAQRVVFSCSYRRTLHFDYQQMALHLLAPV